MDETKKAILSQDMFGNVIDDTAKYQKLNGYVIKSDDFTKYKRFKGTTHLPLAAVELYVELNPGSKVDEVIGFFKQGLRGTPAGLTDPFIISKLDYENRQNQYCRYIMNPITILNSSGTKEEYYVSREWKNGKQTDNLPLFVKHIQNNGYIVLIDDESSISGKRYLQKTEEVGRITPNSTKKEKINVPSGKHPDLGNDENCEFVRYDKSVLENERIPGLCKHLKNEYYQLIEHIRHEFGNRVFDIEIIPVILSKEKPLVYYEETDESVAEMLKNHFNSWGNNLTTQQIAEIISRRGERPQLLLGEYYGGDEPYIKLYFLNMSYEEQELYFSQMAMVLAHEYFHHFHCCLAPACFDDTSDKAKRIIEALADFFSVVYMLNVHGTDNNAKRVAKDRYDSWEDWFGSNWPYAYALWITIVSGVRYRYDEFCGQFKTKSKFVTILENSKSSIENAYDVLINN